MSENINNSPDNNFEKIHLLLYEKIDKEMEAFKVSYKNFDVQQTYNDWYRIGFYESYYEMMSCDFLDNQNAEEVILWLSSKDEPLAFLYNEWMDFDGAFSHDWDDMLDFIRTVYEEEYIREHSDAERNDLQPLNDYLGAYDIPTLMNTLANNAWYGREPTKMSLWAGDDVITIEGYTYEP